MRTLLRSLAAAAVLAATGLPSAAPAGELVAWSPGAKVGYTLGRGFTFGIEVSFVWDAASSPEARDALKMPYAHGLVFDLDSNFKGFGRFHVGYEAIGPFIGIDVGPTIGWDAGGLFGGISLIPWAGYDVIPYYSYTLAFGAEKNFHELGVYGKLAMDPDGGGSHSGSSWDD
jgi:hypothetical protein